MNIRSNDICRQRELIRVREGHVFLNCVIVTLNPSNQVEKYKATDVNDKASKKAQAFSQ